VTEPTNAPGSDADSEDAEHALLDDFLTRHAELLKRIYQFIVRRMDGGANTGGVFTDTVKGFVGYLVKRGGDIAAEDYTPLLFRVATRQIINSHRAHDRTWGLTEVAVHTHLELLAGAMSDSYDDVIRRIDVRRALEQLDGEAQQVLTLRFVDGLTLAETAAVVGGSTTRIFNITEAAKQVLLTRQLLDNYGPPIWRTPQTGTSEAQA
jgi:DNA-directed RNA polymerase specialized sigma24 family protein